LCLSSMFILKIDIRRLMLIVALTLTANVGSYTQGRTAGDFLSSRKAA